MMLKGNAVLLQISDFGLGRGLYIAKALALSGLNVTIFTNEPVFRPVTLEVDDKFASNVRIVELKIPFSKTMYRSVFGRLLFYIVFSMLCTLRLFKERPQPRLIYSRGPQPFTELSSLSFKLFRPKTKIICDTTDIWPDAINFLAIPSILKKLVILFGNALNHFIYSRIASIVTLNEELGSILEKRFNLKPLVIYGVIDLEQFKPLAKASFVEKLPAPLIDKVNGKFVILYAGLLGPFQNPSIITKISEKIANVPDVITLILGEGPLKASVQDQVKKSNLTNVYFLQTQPFEKMPFIYNMADLCLFTYASIDFLKIGLPKKFIEYSAIGRPILCITPICVASKLCSSWKAGFHVYPEEIEKAVEFIKMLKDDPVLRDNMGKNSRKMAEANFSLSAASKKLSKLIQEQTIN